MPIYSGVQKLDELHLNGQKVHEAHMWDGSAWHRVYRVDDGTTPIIAIDGSTAPFVTIFMGSSTTAGNGASDAHHRYANLFSALLVTHAANSLAPAAVAVATSGSPARPTDPGLYFWNSGVGGATSADYYGSSRQTVATALQPNLMIHMIGANDFANQVALATYKSNIQAVLTDARTRSPGVKHLLIHSFVRLDVTNPTIPWSAYGAILTQLADENADVIAAIDVSDLWAARGVLTGGTDPDNLIGADNIHATDAGHAFLADTIATKLGTRLLLRRNEKVWELDPNSLLYANGAEVTSAPPTPGVLESAAGGTGQSAGQRPSLVTNAVNGRQALQFDGSNDSLDINFGASYGFPLTLFMVVKRGAGDRPLFSRTNSTHKGYIYAYASGGQARFVSNSDAASGAYTLSETVWYVLAIVFRADNTQQVYVSSVVPKESSSGTIEAGVGPWIRSLRFGSNTGRSAFSLMTLAYVRLVAGALTPQEVKPHLLELGDMHAISIFVPPPPPQIAGQQVFFSTASALTVTPPDGAQVGDQLVMFMYQKSSTTAIPIPAGWTQVFNSVWGSSRYACFMRQIQNGDTGWTVTGATTRNTACVVAVRGSAGLDVSMNSSATTDSNAINTTSVTTTVPSALVLRYAIAASPATNPATSFTWPADQTEIIDYTNPTNDESSTVAFAVYPETGATGTFSVQTGRTGPRAWAAVALKPIA